MSREKLDSLAKKFQTSYNSLMKQISISGSSIGSAIAKAIIAHKTEFRFDVRYDDNLEQWRIWCPTAGCWLVNSSGVYAFAK